MLKMSFKTAIAPALAMFGVVTAAAAATAPQGLNDKDLARILKVAPEQTAIILQNSSTLSRVPSDTADRLLLWNEIALDTTAIDHTPVAPGEDRVFGEQYGPHKSSRAMAIVHIAMYDAVESHFGTYTTYTGLPAAPGAVSVDAAIDYAAHDTLVSLYPSQKSRLDNLLAQDLVTIKGDQTSYDAGVALGQKAAQTIIKLRTNDGSELSNPEPVVGVNFFPSNEPGKWRPDPVSGLNLALGANWYLVKPFVLTSGSQFRIPPPPALNSKEYTDAYKSVKKLGGDPAHGTPTVRTPVDTFKGKFWSYDGTPALCAPPRLYNQLALTVAKQQGLVGLEDLARFLALLNTTMADAGITAWDSKWYYQYWRPILGIRESDQGSGPTGIGDGNADTIGDVNWYPLGGQSTNSAGPNFTPPFPSYPSGHATFGGAVFETLRHYWPDNTPFVFVSDEYNGKSKDVKGNTRPYLPEYFAKFSDAEYDNAESRIWLGVHWQFDADQGDAAGIRVSDYVFTHAFLPVKK